MVFHFWGSLRYNSAQMKRIILFSLLCICGSCLLVACARPDFVPVEIQSNPTAVLPTLAPEAGVPPVVELQQNSGEPSADAVIVEPTVATVVLERPTPVVYGFVPTPDPPHYAIEESMLIHTVQSGDALGTIAQKYNVSLTELLEENELDDSDFVQIGQSIRVPLTADLITPPTKMIPDSELVYGPSVRDFDILTFLTRYYPESTLLTYSETVEGREISGAEIVELIAVRYSINPRLLLAMIEYRTGWLTRNNPAGVNLNYPMRYVLNGYEGLHNQLRRAADQLNQGYYGRADRGVTSLLIADETRLTFDSTINNGTAAVLTWLGSHTDATYDSWLQDTSSVGFAATYQELFGNPFGFTYEPIVADNVVQPELTLPWDEGIAWYYTAGPHGGWAPGSAWAALDFAPDKDARGCYLHEGWAIASASGRIAYSDFGGVLLDLDGDGDMGTGWVLGYWHIDTFERIQAGSTVAPGQRLGHPSCEGGFSNGTHLHIARRYNGQWISANGELPFVMDGWVPRSTGREYDGFLVKGAEVKEACVCAEELNEIFR